MPCYQCRFVDHAGRVFSTVEIDAPDDGAAIAAAHRLHVNSVGNGFELWDGERPIHVEKRR